MVLCLRANKNAGQLLDPHNFQKNRNGLLPEASEDSSPQFIETLLIARRLHEHMKNTSHFAYHVSTRKIQDNES